MVVPQDNKGVSNGRPILGIIDDLFEENYLVGGAVRDEIMGIETHDLDFAVPYTAEEILKTLKENGYTPRDNAAVFGTIAFNIGKYDIQITSYRIDEYPENSRNPFTIQAADIDSDLARRDFTINSMAVSKEEFIDPYDGVGDISKKIIRSIGDPTVKFMEDPLRILRAYRFISIFGFDLETRTQLAIQQTLDGITRLSTERISDELKKLVDGKYWTDALYEAAEAKVLSATFRRLGFSAPIRLPNVSKIIDEYTSSELEAMDIPNRWLLLFSVLNEAEAGKGVRTLNVASLIQQLAQPLQLKKSLTNEMHDLIEQKMGRPQTEAPSRIDRLREEYSKLHQADDPRAQIVESRLLYEQGKEFFANHSYRRAANCFKKAVLINNKDIDFIISHYEDEEKDRKISAVKSYYIERYSYYLSSVLCENKIYLKVKTGSEAVSMLMRDQSLALRLNQKEIQEAAVKAVLRIYRNTRSGFVEEAYMDFLQAWSHVLQSDYYDRLIKLEFYDQLNRGDLSPTERADIYKQITELAASHLGDTERDFSYYDPLLDMKLWRVLSTTDMQTFWQAYTDLELTTDEYMKYATFMQRTSQAYRRAYLNSASAQIHGLSLTEHIAEKVDLTRGIVADYTMAGYKSSKNALRFKVLLDWIRFVSELSLTDKGIDEIIEIILSKKKSGLR